MAFLDESPNADGSPWVSIARIGLGLVLLIGGVKLAIPADPAGLASSYVDPETGWIAPYFADWIQGTLGLEVITFLNVMGTVELIVGLGLVLGLWTPVWAGIAAVLFWAFAVANPVVGAVRLSRDLTLMGIAAALAVGGPGRWSLDAAVRAVATWIPDRADLVQALIRYSIAYTLILSAVFRNEVMANVLNTTLPWLLVGAMGLLLVLGVYPRVILGGFVLWMTVMIAISVVQDPVYAGLDGVKREIGMATAALFYAVRGPDRWTWMGLPDRASTVEKAPA